MSGARRFFAVALALGDPDLLQIVRDADLVTADGVGVLWAARRAGSPLPERVSGVDIAEKLFELSAAKGYTLALVGAAPGVADRAAERMRHKYPGCRVVFTRDGYFKPADDAQVASEVGAHQPDILLVAMGMPRQEKFISEQRGRHRAKVAIGVGGTFDVLSGTIRRAPQWVRSLKAEWLWRILMDPKKIKKASSLPRFVMRVLRSPR